MPTILEQPIIKKADVLAMLRQKVREIEGFKVPSPLTSMCFGIDKIDQSFADGSMPLGTTHEFITDVAENTAATVSFIASVLAKMNQSTGTVLWISKSKTLYVPGLLPFGLNPDRIVFIRVSRDQEALWAIEESLRAKGLMAVVGEIGNADFIATQRLQHAVEKSGTTGFLLRINPKQQEQSSVCVTRWKIRPIPSEEENGLPGVGTPRWKVALEKVRHGQPGQWDIEWYDNEFRLINPPIKPTANPFVRMKTA